MKIMKKTINFGKIDFCGAGRKINSVDVEMELKENEGRPVLSVCGEVWNARHTDCVAGGQCLDDLTPFFKNNRKFCEIHRLWKSYHLNDMHAGDRAQEEYLRDNLKGGYDYGKACELLKQAGLYEHDGYKYGHGWIYEPIPEDDLLKIKSIMSE